MSRHLKTFDRYFYYMNSVQSPDSDSDFLLRVYRDLRNDVPQILREDFCGTFAISCEWVKLHKSFRAFGVDLDPEPIAYGLSHYKSKLKPDEQARLNIIQSDVLKPNLPRADIIAVFNFSCYFFKVREQMVTYYRQCLKRLKSGGLLVIDAFGGPLCEEPNIDKIRYRGFTYFWEQASFEPISRNAKFYIHFKRKGERKRSKVFRYDWRMWTLPELREMMGEAGFSKTHVYWECTNRNGSGNGQYRRRETGEVCGAWVAYVIGEK